MISTAPVVSVIMATKNPKIKYLERSVKSILNQSLQNFELLIFDDGSDCLVQHVLRELQLLPNDKITIIRNSTSVGSSIARNKLISQARGNFIAVMDDDDLSKTNRLAVEHNFLINHPDVAFVGSQVEVVESADESVERVIPLQYHPTRREYLWNSPYIHPSVMFRKTALIAVGGFPEDKWTVHRAEDYDLFLRLYVSGNIGVNLSEPLLVYTESPAIMKKKRKYRYRWAEVVVRFRNFKLMKLRPIEWLYVIKPLVAGLVPSTLLFFSHSRKR